MQLRTPCRQTHTEFSSSHTWLHLQEFNHNRKTPNTGGSGARELPTHAGSRALSDVRDGRASPGTLALPPASHCANTRAPSGDAAAPGAGGRAGGAGAPPGEGTRGRGAGAGRRPAHVGGREQLKVRSGARAVLSRAALARAAAAAKEEEEKGGRGGGERGGEDGGGVGLEPSGGASCPGRSRELARRAPTPELHPAVPSSARVRAPAGSAPGLPPE